MVVRGAFQAERTASSRLILQVAYAHFILTLAPTSTHSVCTAMLNDLEEVNLQHRAYYIMVLKKL